MAAARAVALVSAIRTPIGRFCGGLSSVPAPELGATAVRAALEAARLAPGEVESLTFNPARQVLVRAGIPVERPAATINQACASGLKAIQLAADEILLGRAQVVVAGGMENMSRVPFLLDRMREGYRLGHGPVVDNMYRDGFHCPMADMVMGETAELLARERGISRAEQDAFALASQEKAAAALAEDRFRNEIVPVTVIERRDEKVVDRDEHPRPDTTMEKLAKLPPVFDRSSGSVSAGNASGITDGAAALVLMAGDEAERRGLEPLAHLTATEVVGCDPKRMGLGPVPATRALLERTGWKLDDFDTVELNEAFAAQVLAVLQELPIERERLNPNGGSIALGHPIGCTGARIAVTLVHELQRAGARRGLATLCVSGGLGFSAAFERP